MAEGEETDRQSDSSRSGLPDMNTDIHHHHYHKPLDGEFSSYSGEGFDKHPLWPLIWGIPGVLLRPNLGEGRNLETCKGGGSRDPHPTLLLYRMVAPAASGLRGSFTPMMKLLVLRLPWTQDKTSTFSTW